VDRDAADVITGSEHILKAYADKHTLTATASGSHKNVLKNPEFNADDVDTDMLQRLQAAIDSGDLQDGPQVLELFARPVCIISYAFALYRTRYRIRYHRGRAGPSVTRNSRELSSRLFTSLRRLRNITATSQKYRTRYRIRYNPR
jgi:hypothetical protein